MELRQSGERSFHRMAQRHFSGRLALDARRPSTGYPLGRDAALGMASLTQSRFGVRQYLAVTDAEGFDPALLAQGQSHELSELDQLGNSEVPM